MQIQKNKIKCVVFDWAGTTVDFGCRAPLAVFLSIFKNKGIPIIAEEASKSMGKLKIDHIRELLSYQRIRNEYINKFNKDPDENAVKELYSLFEPALFKLLPDYSAPIPHVLDTINKLRSKGILIGSTTGYTKEMMEIVMPVAEKHGYKPDYMISSSEVKMGRPAPHMMFHNAMNFGIFPMFNIIKVGDTVADINEGQSAGAWTVGLLTGSSLMGFSQAEYSSATAQQIKDAKMITKKRYEEEGADFVIDNMSELQGVMEEINERLGKNEFPGNAKVFPMQPYLLFTPGPITTSKDVKMSMMTDWGSRETDYLELVQNVRKKLCEIACPSDVKNASQLYTTVIMQGSGTFGVEACVGTVIPKGGKLCTIINGNYGQRMSQIASILNIPKVDVAFEENEIPDLDKLEQVLKNDKEITHLGVIHSETTTGILNPLEPLCKLAKKYNKVLIVDAMSSFGAIPIDIKQLDIDFLVSSSNKNLEGVPGFAFVIAKVSELSKCKENRKSLSLDLYDQWNYLEKTHGGFRFTSPVHAIRAFNQALIELDLEGGVEKRFQRYTNMQRILSEGMVKLGFEPLDLKGHQGPIITTFMNPKDSKYDFDRFYNLLKDKKCVIYPGKLTKANTFRIGTIGKIDEADIEYLLEKIQESIFWNNKI